MVAYYRAREHPFSLSLKRYTPGSRNHRLFDLKRKMPLYLLLNDPLILVIHFGHLITFDSNFKSENFVIIFYIFLDFLFSNLLICIF